MPPVSRFEEARRTKPGFPAWRKELLVLARYVRRLVEVVTCQDAQTGAHLPLGDILRRSSELSHLGFALYRKSGTAFLPGQNYSNTQLMCRAKLFAAAYAKAEDITECFSFFVSDDRLEGFFGMGRVAGCGRNFDALEFEQRARSVTATHARATRRI